MTRWTVKVKRVGRRSAEEEERFVVVFLDLKGPHVRGPDGGKNNAGYTEPELRRALADIYELSEVDIDNLIRDAEF